MNAAGGLATKDRRGDMSIEEVLGLAAKMLVARKSSTDDRVYKVAHDVREFAKYAWLSDPNKGEIPFAMWDWQPGLLELWDSERLVCVLKARQLGVSWLIAVYVAWRAMFMASQRILLVSIGQRDADELLAKVAFVISKLPDWMRPPDSLLTVNARTIRFEAHDSEIESLPASGVTGRSRTASLVVLDEHAHQQNADAIWLAIKPTIENGRLISVSTANGLGVLHTRLYKAAVEGANRFVPVFIPWTAHPERDAEWYDIERAEMSVSSQPQMFEQEYPANDIEAFVVSGSPVWTAAELDRQPIANVEPREPGLWVYADPVPGARYVIGADTAEGIPGGDWCSASVLRITREAPEPGEAPEYRGEHVAQLRGLWPPEEYAKRLDALARMYGQKSQRGVRNVWLGVERNNHGHAVLLRLRQLNPKDSPYGLSSWKKALGWVTTAQTRPVMYDELAGAIRSGQVAVRDPVTVSQMATFKVTKQGGEAQAGFHDDDITASAIAWQHHRRAFGVVIG